ncbi:MAG TPA: hypothetical protein VLZ76_05440 [Lysobacter sp.]|nr:hypothetical protein [Lysobacter sp.]
MTANKLHYAVAAALFATLALAGCKKNPSTMENEVTPPPAMTEPAPPAEPMPAEPMPAETAVSVTSVTLGTEAGADKTIATPMTSFAAKDPIVVSIATNGAASNVDIAAKLVYQDGQTAGEQSQTINATGMETTNITFTNANGWPTGSYTAEVSVNGTQAQSTPFTVK